MFLPGLSLNRFWPLLILLPALAAPLAAHHSWAGEYFVDKTISIHASVVKFEYGNPHSLLRLEVAGDQGAPEPWIGEWSGAGKLSNEGIGKNKLKPGDDLTVIGNPGRPPDEHRIHVLGIRRRDGFQWGRQK